MWHSPGVMGGQVAGEGDVPLEEDEGEPPGEEAEEVSSCVSISKLVWQLSRLFCE